MYVDMVGSMYCSYLDPERSYKELHKLTEKIQKFKAAAYEVVSDHQASKMGTQRWHALDHVCDVIREVGDLVYPHAGFLKVLINDLKMPTLWLPKEPVVL